MKDPFQYLARALTEPKVLGVGSGPGPGLWVDGKRTKIHRLPPLKRLPPHSPWRGNYFHTDKITCLQTPETYEDKTLA